MEIFHASIEKDCDLKTVQALKAAISLILPMKELSQDVFDGQPPEVDWAGVDFDGTLNFGVASSPRFTWASERWRGFKRIGNRVQNSGYKPLSQLRRTL